MLVSPTRFTINGYLPAFDSLVPDAVDEFRVRFGCVCHRWYLRGGFNCTHRFTETDIRIIP